MSPLFDTTLHFADGKLTAAHMCAVVAALLPESAVVVDESLTSSRWWLLTIHCLLNVKPLATS